MNKSNKPLPIDITGNYRAIESLKVSLLKNTASLYEFMQPGGRDSEDAADVLGEMIINICLMADKMGIEYDKLDDIIKSRLKIMALEEENSIYNISELLKHMQNK